MALQTHSIKANSLAKLMVLEEAFKSSNNDYTKNGMTKTGRGYESTWEVISNVLRTNSLTREDYINYKKKQTVAAATLAVGNCLISKTDISSEIINSSSNYKARLIDAEATVFGTSASLFLDMAIVFFDSDPSASTFTAGSNISIASADRDKIIGMHSLKATGITIGTTLKQFASSGTIDDEIVVPNGVLYYALVNIGGSVVNAAAEIDLVMDFDRKNIV